MQITRCRPTRAALLATDVAWQTHDGPHHGRTCPAGVTLTSFTGQVTPPVAAAAAPTPVTPTAERESRASRRVIGRGDDHDGARRARTGDLTGTITFQGTAKDYPTLAAWIDAMGKVPQVADVYVTNAQRVARAEGRHDGELTFTAIARCRPSRAEQPARASSSKAETMKTKNLAVGILAGVLVVALWYTLLLKPTRGQGDEGQGRDAGRAGRSCSRCRRSSRRRSATRRNAAEFKAQLASLQQAMPDTPALAAFIRDANGIAAAIRHRVAVGDARARRRPVSAGRRRSRSASR